MDFQKLVGQSKTWSVMQYLLNFEDNSSFTFMIVCIAWLLLQYSGRVFAGLRDGFKITGGKK